MLSPVQYQFCAAVARRRGRSFEPDDGSEMNEELQSLVGSDPHVNDFFRLLAVCHTVQVDQRGDEPVYQAASPDDKALVEGARDYGVQFLDDANEVVRISFQGKEETYERLHVLEFDSTRKRMSVIARDDQGRYFIFAKGADSIMMPLLSEESRNEGDAWHRLDANLTLYSEVGLRTLVLAQREFTKAEYDDWSRRYHDAETSESDRDKLKDQLQTEVESGLTLIGATAIEDKLQVGVPETIQKLKDGGIKVCAHAHARTHMHARTHIHTHARTCTHTILTHLLSIADTCVGACLIRNPPRIGVGPNG